MKTIRRISLMAFLITIVTSTFAQQTGRVKFKINYNLAMPTGSFKSDYISNTSFRGANGEISYWFNPKFSLGLAAGYQSYQQKYGRQVYKTDDNQYISAVLTNTVETMPVLINGTFAPLAGTKSLLQPYASLGAGVNLINYNQYLGQFSNATSNAGLTAKAEAGLMIPIGKKERGSNLQFGVNYNFSPYNKNGLSKLNNAGVNAGVIFPLK